MSRGDYIKTIDLSKECLILTKFSFKTVAEAGGSIVGVGGIIKALLAFVPDENSVMAKLKELGRNIDALSDKMNARFDDMKAFISESNFYIMSSPNLIKYTINCIDHPKTEEAFRNFEDAYKKDSPLNMTYTVIRILENNVTNPLKKAMDADPLKTKATFDKWVAIIDGVLAQFLFLEAFAFGLLKKTSAYDWDQIIKERNKLFVLIDQWREEYKTNASYWPGLGKYIGEYQDSHKHLSLAQKADGIKHQLDLIMTNDAFYVLFFEEKWFEEEVFTYYASVNGQLIESRKRGNCSAIIYRSKQANFVGMEKFVQMEKDTETLKNRMPPSLQGAIGMISSKNQISNAGFVCLVGSSGLQIRSANCPRRTQGPGHVSNTVQLSDRHAHMPISISASVIAGYL